MSEVVLGKEESASQEATIIFEFKSRIDTDLVAIKGDKGSWMLSIRHGSLFLKGHIGEVSISLDMEDTISVKDDSWHTLAVRSSATGSQIFLDGYQCFSSTASLSPAALGGSNKYRFSSAPGLSIRGNEFYSRGLSSHEILALSREPEPLIEFAAKELSQYDVETVQELRTGSIFARYRVRGPGQYGTILAAGGPSGEKLALKVDSKGITYSVMGRHNQWRHFIAKGSWDQGKWHDVVIRTGRGAVDIYVDGFMEAHYPGQVFFNEINDLNTVVIGQDTEGTRLFGEVRNAAIYGTVLQDAQIKKLSNIQPLRTDCLFDTGYKNSISYRIPSILTTAKGTIIAGADQRETIANDAPNSINFVIRRSLDGGETWEDLQSLISYPGKGESGASVIDSCIVQDKNTGRIIVLIDHFPGGIGQPNAEQGVGVDKDGQFLLYDQEGNKYFWRKDGRVDDSKGKPTSFRVDKDGNIAVASTSSRDGKTRPGGNVFLCRGEDPNETLLTARTSYIQMIYSDDEGKTWSKPVNLDHQVKEEWMRFLGTSPGNGIQLSKGKHSGRLLIPIYYNSENWLSFSCAVLYSDDGGTTWHRGKSPNDGREFDGKVLNSQELECESAAMHESTIVERNDGSVLMLMRNQHPKGKVATAISNDGGETWGSVSFAEEIDEIFSLPNAVAAPTSDEPERVVFANASQMMPYRGRGVLRLSYDGGNTWPISRTFNPAHYVYQCMTVLPHGDLGLLWERETQGIYFSKIPFSWFS